MILCNYWRELKENALFFRTRIIFIRQPRWLIFNLNIFAIFLPICVDKLNLNKTEKAFNLKVGHSPWVSCVWKQLISCINLFLGCFDRHTIKAGLAGLFLHFSYNQPKWEFFCVYFCLDTSCSLTIFISPPCLRLFITL